MPAPFAIDFEMRRGRHPDQEMDGVEQLIAEMALTRMSNNAGWNELGFRKAYNLSHLYTFHCTRNPQLIKLAYRLQPYPSYLEIEATQGCPHKCVMCETTFWNEPTLILSWKKFRHIVDQFPDLKWIGINAIGEPFLNRKFMNMLRYMSEKQVCQELYTTTQMLNEKDMRDFVKYGIVELFKFSLDAATPETYKKIRPKINWENEINNIKALDYYKKKYNKYFPEIHFHYLIMKQSIGETLDFLDFINGLNIDVANIYFSRLLHNFKEINDVYIEVPEDLVIKLQEKGKKLNIPVSFSQDIHNQAPINECVAWQMPYIFADGTVISCCCMNLQNRRDWQRKTSLGNIFDKSFREIWIDEPYTKLRNMLWNKKPNLAHPACKMCNIYNPTKLSDIRSDLL